MLRITKITAQRYEGGSDLANTALRLGPIACRSMFTVWVLNHFWKCRASGAWHSFCYVLTFDGTRKTKKLPFEVLEAKRFAFRQSRCEAAQLFEFFGKFSTPKVGLIFEKHLRFPLCSGNRKMFFVPTFHGFPLTRGSSGTPPAFKTVAFPRFLPTITTRRRASRTS